MKKNIAIVITRLDLGGAQKTALYLAEKLDKKKYNVFLITGCNGYLDSEAKEITGLDLLFMKELRHPISPIKDITAIFKLKDYFIKNKMDIVHTHSSKAGILGRFAAKMAGVKKIIHTVHGFSFHEHQNFLAHGLYVVLEKMAADMTDRLVAVGKDTAEYGLKNGVGTKDKYTIIRAGIDINMTRRTKVDAKKYLKAAGLKPGVYTVGMIGNLKKQKNPVSFVKIAAEALAADSSLQFVFAGDGPMRNKISELLKKCGIEDKVKFIGWINEPEKFLKAIDLFMLTSLWEGLACTIPQAIAAGKPCLVSDIPGNREIIQNGKTGFLFSPFDSREAAEKIIWLKANKKQALKFTKAAFAAIKGEFDLKQMLKKYEEAYAG